MRRCWGGRQTSVHLSLEYEPEGIVEGIGDKLHQVENRVEADLETFKEFAADLRASPGQQSG
jgi:uncharacterized membrane protein